MVKLGLIQTISYSTNQKGIFRVSEMLKKLGKKETEIVCLPEQWLKKNEILDFDSEFSDFKKIAKEFSQNDNNKITDEIKEKLKKFLEHIDQDLILLFCYLCTCVCTECTRHSTIWFCINNKFS